MDQSTQYSLAPLLLMPLAEVDEELERARAESARAACWCYTTQTFSGIGSMIFVPGNSPAS